METVLLVEPHTELAIQDFAKQMNITPEWAGYIENMRERYVCWEHGYVKENLSEMD